MNIMDKQFITEFANRYYLENRVLRQDIDYIITSYCEEFNKNPHKTQTLISLIMHMGDFSPYIKTALDYYMRKYNINLLLNTQQNVIKII